MKNENQGANLLTQDFSVENSLTERPVCEVDCYKLQALVVSVDSLQCHHLVEAKEEVIENWWFKHYAKGIDTNLNSYLCVSRMKGLCTV